MEAVELEQIGTSIRSAMGESAGQFRQAAAKNNEDIGKVVKDISRMFKTQREELNEIGNTLQDSIHQSELESVKMDRLAGIFEESVQIQNDMLTELKRSSAGMKYIGDNIVQLNSNIMGSSGILGTLTGLNTSVGSIGTNVAAALLGAGIGAAGGAMIGAGAGGADAHTPVKTSGSFAQHQQEAYTAARAELSDKGAKILVANLSGESLKDPGDVHPDPSRSNPFQKAHGIASWSDVRSEKIKNQFGKYPQQMSVEEQTKALMWEMKKDYPKAWEALKNENLSDRDRLWAVVKHFENPARPEADTEKRMGYLAGLKVSGAGESQTPIADAVGSAAAAMRDKGAAFMQDEGRGKFTPNADQPTQATPVPSADVSRTEVFKDGHGPISGAKEHGHGEQEKLSGVQPGILQKFQQIESQAGTSLQVTSGYRDPKHNAEVGGAKNSAHMRGNAVDVSFGGGVPQALKLIEIASKAGIGGIGVYSDHSLHFDTESRRAWGKGYHYEGIAQNTPWASKAIEAHLSGQWGKYDPSAAGGDVSKRAGGGESPMQGPVMPNIGPPMPSTGQGEATQTTPAEQVSSTPAVSAPMSGGEMGAMMGMMSGMLPGGMGGMVGMLAPMLMGAISSMQMPESPQAALETTPSTGSGDMLQALSRSIDNTEMLKQAAVSKQAQQESAQDPITEALNGIFGQQQNVPGVNTTSSMGGVYDGYNGPSDIGWPDWAEMIGGNHWKEMKNYKKNMWG